MTTDRDPNAFGRASVALVTGASRGIGAATARRLAAVGVLVVVNYRQKQRRADDVVAQIRTAGGSAIAVGADLTHTDQVRSMFATIDEQFGALDVLILNASGGMELDADPGYAMRLNRDAQMLVLEEALIRMPTGGRVVFVTSHQAHFHGQQPGVPAYDAVAASKRAGEDAIRAHIPHMNGLGVSLTVVSGDMIDGTITVTLLDRANPGLLERRRRDVGDLPTIDEFADAVATATTMDAPTGHTIYVGGADYLTRAATQPNAAPDRAASGHKRATNPVLTSRHQASQGHVSRPD